jgi:hypothetical protein
VSDLRGDVEAGDHHAHARARRPDAHGCDRPGRGVARRACRCVCPTSAPGPPRFAAVGPADQQAAAALTPAESSGPAQPRTSRPARQIQRPKQVDNRRSEPRRAVLAPAATRMAVRPTAVLGALYIPLGRARVVPRKQPMRLDPRDRVVH